MTTPFVENRPRTTTLHDPMVPLPATVTKVLWETDDTFTLQLELSAFSDGFAFRPGQFNMLYMFGIGESAISISSDPAKAKTLSHTIHRVGTVTKALSQVKRGDVVGIRGPFGTPWPVEAARARDVCVVAGGIGLAPLRPLLYDLFRNRGHYNRIMILYGARSPLDLLFRVELEAWAKDYYAEVLATVDRSDSSWKGNIGVVTSLFSYVKLDARETVAYVCGPETMMKFTLQELEKRGVPDDQVYLSIERNMKCAIGFCGHCQFGPTFVCKDGPVFPRKSVQSMLNIREM